MDARNPALLQAEDITWLIAPDGTNELRIGRITAKSLPILLAAWMSELAAEPVEQAA